MINDIEIPGNHRIKNINAYVVFDIEQFYQS